MSVLYVTHRMRRTKSNFSMFLPFFDYAESNAAVLSSTIYAKARILRFKMGFEYLSTRTGRKGPARNLVQYTAHIYASFIYFKLFSSMLNIMPSGVKLNYSCKNLNFAILVYV